MYNFRNIYKSVTLTKLVQQLSYFTFRMQKEIKSNINQMSKTIFPYENRKTNSQDLI
jgi:hypothetical protein